MVFEAVEGAVRLAMEKFYGETTPADIVVTIDRDNGEMTAKKGEEAVDPAILGRIAAQSRPSKPSFRRSARPNPARS